MNQALSDKLLGALRKIDRPGSFCAQGSVPTVLPGLEVENVGAIGLPLSASCCMPLVGFTRNVP